MKIYLVVEEYEGVKRVVPSYDVFGQPDYTLEYANNTQNYWSTLHSHLGAVYTVVEVEV